MKSRLALQPDGSKERWFGRHEKIPPHLALDSHLSRPETELPTGFAGHGALVSPRVSDLVGVW